MKIYKYILSILFTGLLFSGCYTVVQHPSVEDKDENGYTVSRDVDFYDDCNSCHTADSQHSYSALSDAEIERAHRPLNDDNNYYSDDYYYDRGGYYYDYGNFGSNIGYYYNRPWWYDYRYDQGYSTGGGDNGKSTRSSETTRLRDNDGGRGNSRQGRTSSSSGTIDRPSVSAPSSGSSPSGTPSRTSSANDNNKSSNPRSRTERDYNSDSNSTSSSSSGSSSSSTTSTSSSSSRSSDQPRSRDNDGGRSSSDGGRSSSSSGGGRSSGGSGGRR